MAKLLPLLSVLIVLLCAAPALATIRYVDATAGACTGNYSIANRDCTGTDGNSYATIAAGLTPTVAGDTLYVRAANYAVSVNLSGKNGTPSAGITFAAYPGDTVTLSAPLGNRPFTEAAYTYLTIDGLVLDGVNQGTSTCTSNCLGWSLHEYNSHVTVKNLEMKNFNGTILVVSTGLPAVPDSITFHNVNVHDTRSDCVPGRRWYAYYIAHGSNIIIENGSLSTGGGGAIQIYPGPLSGVVFRNNEVFDNGFCSTSFNGAVLVGASGSTNVGTQVYGNRIYHNGYTGAPEMDGVETNGAVSDTKIWNNTIYDNTGTGATYGVRIGTGATGTVVQNNLIFGNKTNAVLNNGTGSTLSFNACIAAESCGTTGKVTITALTSCTVSTTDFTLKSASSCLNVGTPVGSLFYNGSAPDIGAYESATYASASINEALLDVTIGESVSDNLPLVPTAAGWSVGCSGGANCGTPVVSNASLKSGSSSIIRLTITGFGGGGVCEVGQTITVSYSSTTGATVNAVGQELMTFTTQAVTNGCGSAPSSPPGTPLITYNFDENTGTTAADGTGGDQPGTLTNGPTWEAPGKTGASAVHFAGGGDDLVAVPYGSGLNPSTTSWADCMWVKLTAGQTGGIYTFFGVPNGTNQRMYLSFYQSTWTQGVQASNGSISNPEFPVTFDTYTRVCQRVNKDTNVVSLAINGVVGTSAVSTKAVTSYTLSGNFNIGTHTVTGGQPDVTIDGYIHYDGLLSNADLLTDFLAAEPPAVPTTGTLTQCCSQIRYLRKSSAGAVVSYGALNAVSTTLSTGAAFGVDIQTDCTDVDCDPISESWYFSCNNAVTPRAGCNDATAYTVISNFVAPGQIIYFYGNTADQDIVTGSVARLSGALTETLGQVVFDASAVPNYDLPQNGSINNRGIFQLGTGALVNDSICLRKHNQNGNTLDAYTVTPCILAEQPTSGAGL